MRIKALAAGLVIGCAFLGTVPGSTSATAKITDPPNVSLVWVTKLQDTWIEIQTIENYKEHQVDTIIREVQQTAEWTCKLYDKEAVVVSQMLEVDRRGAIVNSVYMRFLVACVVP